MADETMVTTSISKLFLSNRNVSSVAACCSEVFFIQLFPPDRYPKSCEDASINPEMKKKGGGGCLLKIGSISFQSQAKQHPCTTSYFVHLLCSSQGYFIFMIQLIDDLPFCVYRLQSRNRLSAMQALSGHAQIWRTGEAEAELHPT
jgi:hypothetical protein